MAEFIDNDEPYCALHDIQGRRCWDCSLRTLAANLAVGAGLCLAFRHGAMYGNECAYLMADETPSEWRPGCGRRAPGWER